MANKGLKNYTKQLTHIIGNAGKANINLNYNPNTAKHFKLRQILFYRHLNQRKICKLFPTKT